MKITLKEFFSSCLVPQNQKFLHHFCFITIAPIFSLGLFHEITNRLSCMQHIHVHTPSGNSAVPLSYFKLFRSFHCPPLQTASVIGLQRCPKHLPVIRPQEAPSTTSPTLSRSNLFACLPTQQLLGKQMPCATISLKPVLFTAISALIFRH